MTVRRQERIKQYHSVSESFTIECSKTSYNKYFIRPLTCRSRKYTKDCSTCWISRLNRYFDLQNDHVLRSPPCNTQTQQRKRDIRFSKSFCPAVIDAKSHELHIKLRQIYPVFEFGGTSIIPSMHCLTSSVSLGAGVSRPVRLLKIYIKPA